MARVKKDGVNINYYIRKDIKNKLDAYCEDVGQTATTAIERILEKHLDEYFSKKNLDDNKAQNINIT